ncbi:unnamed protein product, partial [Symbiodinium pilosum]
AVLEQLEQCLPLLSQSPLTIPSKDLRQINRLLRHMTFSDLLTWASQHASVDVRHVKHMGQVARP